MVNAVNRFRVQLEIDFAVSQMKGQVAIRC